MRISQGSNQWTETHLKNLAEKEDDCFSSDVKPGPPEWKHRCYHRKKKMKRQMFYNELKIRISEAQTSTRIGLTEEPVEGRVERVSDRNRSASAQAHTPAT